MAAAAAVAGAVDEMEAVHQVAEAAAALPEVVAIARLLRLDLCLSSKLQV